MPLHCLFWLQVIVLRPCRLYPALHWYVTVEPQLYGPKFGFQIPFCNVGGLLHSQITEIV